VRRRASNPMASMATQLKPQSETKYPKRNVCVS
jgi:hypothetical protein